MGKPYLLFLAFFFLFVNTAKGATYYWVGGTGNWNVISNWATTSGGTIHYTSIPSSTDDVIFDSNANYQVTISAGSCHNMRWIGTGTPRMVLSGKLDISGSLELQPGMQMYASAGNTSISLTFSSTTTGNTIKTSGVVIGNGTGTAFGVGVIFRGVGGAWTLSDDYITTKGAAITLTAGSLNFGGKMVSIDSFTDGGTANTLAHALNIAGSSITLFATNIPGGGTITNSGWNYSSANGLALSPPMSTGSTITLNNFTTTGIVTKINDTYNDVILLKGATTVSSVGTGETTFNHFTTYDDTFFSGNRFNYLNLLGEGSYTFVNGAINPIYINNALVAQSSTCGGTIGLNAENSTRLGNQTQFTFAAGATATVQNALIRNISTAGLVPNAVNSVDLGNNTGWSFTGAGVTYYWVGGPGSWNDVAHWSLTTGGVSGGCLPTAFDNVIFDNNSGASVAVTIDESASCSNITWNNAAGAVFNVNDKFFISGSLTLQAGMAMNVASITNIINFVGNTPNNITTNGVTLNVEAPPFRNNDIITFSRLGGSWTLMDDFNAPYASLDLNVGDLNFGGKNATIFSFKVTAPNISGSAKLEINNSTITCTISAALGYLNYAGWSDHTSNTFAGPTISALNTSGSTIILEDSKFDTHSSIYNNIIFKGATSSSLYDSYASNIGNTTITSLTFLSNGSIAEKMQAKIGTLTLSPGSSYLFPVPTTAPVSNGIVTVTTALNADGGLCSGIISIASSAAGTQATIAAAGSIVNVNNATLQDILITGSTPYAAANSTDEGNNTGWNFTAPIVHNYYWVGGTGSWNDPVHWANSSGGLSGSGCIPTASDNVFFDGGSGFTASSTVMVDGYSYCNNMTWSGSTIPAALDIESPISIYGSLELQSGMTVKGNTDGGTSNISYFNFAGSTPGNTIKTNGVTINIPASTQPNGLVFNGTSTASWKLLDPLTVTSWVTLSGGNLNFNGQTVTMAAFTTGSGPVAKPRSLNIADSAITLKGGIAAMAAAWNYNVSGAAPLTSNETAGSTITFAIASQTITAKATDVYNDLIIKASGMTINGGIYHKADFTGATTNSFATFNSSPVIDILTMKSGGTYFIQTGSTLTINNVFSPNGTPCSITKISSNTNGVQANISMPSGAANFPNNIYGIDFVQMQDINAITPASDPTRAQMRVGNNSTAENRNNTGWIIVPHTSNPVVDGLGVNRTLGCNDYPYVLTTTAFFPNPEATFKWNDNSTGDTLTVTGPGTYSVTVTYGAGCALSGNVTLGLTPNPNLGIASAISTCTEIEVILSVTGLTGSSSNATYTLQSVSPANAMPGLPVIQNNNAVFHIPTGVTNATFTVTDNNSGCTSAPLATSPLPALLPHAVITGGTSLLCAGETATSAFIADLPDGTWSVSNTAVASISSGGILTALAVPVTTTVNVIYTTDNGCTTISDVTINPIPIISGAVSLCRGSAATLTAMGGTGTWTSQTPLIATVDANGAVQGISSGTGQITYTLTDTGCSATYDITINAPVLIVTDPPAICSGTAVDLTAPAITTGSSANLTFAYFTDPAGTVVLANPDAVTADGIYYIKGTTPEGCSDIQDVTVTVNPLPVVTTTNPPAVCWPATVDITAGSATAGSTANLTYAYFSDAAGTQPLANPNAVTASDTYYIQGTDPVTGCSAISGINLVVNLLPDASFTYGAINNDNDVYAFAPITVTPGMSYSWNFGDTNISSDPNPTNEYTAAGNYIVTLTVTNPNTGCTNTTTEAITITKSQNVTADITVVPVNQCIIGNVFQYSSVDSVIAPGYTLDSITWDFGDGTPFSNDSAPSHSYAAAGTYILNLQVTVTGNGNTFSDSATSSIIVIATPEVKVTNPAPVCSKTVNITSAAVTSGSTPGLTFTYYTDAAGTIVLANADALADSGTYYIKGTTPEGCFSISPVVVTINPTPTVKTVAPAAVCTGTTVNLTVPAVTDGSSLGLTFTYFTDAAGTAVLATPGAVTTGGTYYIKGTTPQGCSAISPVQVTINPIPLVTVTNPAAVCSGTLVDLTAPAVTTGSTANLTFTYFKDAAGTTDLGNPNAVLIGGTYYIKGTTAAGCSAISPVQVTVNPIPLVNVTNLPAVCSGTPVDLTVPAVTAGSDSNLTFTYFTNAAGTAVLAEPSAVTVGGTYYIKGTTTEGCSAINAVQVTINPIPLITVNNPAAVCSDTTVDLTAAAVTAGSDSNLTFAYFTDAAASNDLSNPDAVTASGTYYIRGTSPEGCSAIIQIQVTINPIPIVTVTDPAAVCTGTAVDLTAAAVTTGSTENLTFNYFTDAAGTTVLDNADTVTAGGTYYIQGTTPEGCSAISPVVVSFNPIPLVTITDPGASCSDTPIDLTTSAVTAGSSANLTFTYFTDAAGTTVLENADAITTSGIYYIKGTTPEGCSTISPVQVTVNPTPTVVTVAPLAVCSGTPVDLTAAAVTAESTLNLTFSYFTDAAGTAVLANPNAVTAGGTYYIKGTTADGCSAIRSVAVTINPTPTVKTVAPAAVCSGTPVDLTAAAITAGSTANLAFTYFTDAAGTIALTNPNAVTAGGIYYIKGTTAQGCATIQSVAVTVNPLPVIAITNPAAVCWPATADITSASITTGSTPNLSFAYFSDAAGTQPLANANAITTSGTYYIQGTDPATGCTSIRAVNVIVNLQPDATFTYDAINNANDQYTFTPIAVTTGMTYNWDFGDGTTSTVTIPTHQYNVVGNYTVRLTVISTSGCTATTTEDITITKNPNVAADISVSPVDQCFIGNAFQFNSASTVAAGYSITGLIWDFGDGAPVSNALTPSHTYAAPGTYIIKLQATASNGINTFSDNATSSIIVIATPVLNVTNPAPVCAATTVDITVAAVTSGSTPGLIFTYFTDAAGTTVLANPTAVTTGGTYYIKGTTSEGCSAISPVQVTINSIPVLNITNPAAVCSATVDLTAAAITAGSTPNITFTYFTNAAGTTVVANPNAVTAGGTYYIKGTTAEGCSAIRSVAVTINPTPTVKTVAPAAVCSGTAVDLTTPAVTTGSTPNLTFTYFTDAAGTIALADPNAVTAGGIYYIKGTTAQGCATIQSVTVTVNPLPIIAVTNPAAVCWPTTVDLTTASVTTGSTQNLSYAYFSDAAGTQPLANANAITTSGTYYIQGTNPATGCTSISAVNVIVNLQPDATFTYDAINNQNDQYTFTPISATTGMTYNWDFGDGTTSTVTIPTHQYNVVGNYTVRLTVISTSGCTATTTEDITITKDPNVAADISISPVDQCFIGNGFQLSSVSTVAAGYSITSLSWNFGDGTPVSNALTPTHTYAAPGTYIVSLQATASNGINTFSDNATSSIIVIATPVLNVTNPAPVCAATTVDITAAAVTSGSTPGLIFTYFTDAAGSTVLANPNAVTASGTYYIKGITPEGCSAITPVEVTINPLPVVTITNPAAVCSGTPVDLTAAAITFGSTSNLIYNYFTDAAGTTVLVNPTAVTTGGTYYIEGTTAEGCSVIQRVTVTINPTPTVKTVAPAAVCSGTPVDLTTPAVTAGSTSNLTFTYFTDAAGTTALANPNAVTAGGTYYIKGTTAQGCAAIQSVTVTINPIPIVTITNPAAVCSGTAVNLTAAAITVGSTSNLTFTYFTDAAGTTVLANPTAVTAGGTYYIKGTTPQGCSAIRPVQVIINPIPVVTITNPAAVCSGTPVDLTAAALTAGSTPNLTFTYFTNSAGTVVLANPAAVTTGGVYYIKGTTPQGCSAIQSVTVTINVLPTVTVVNPSAICAGSSVDLTTTVSGASTYTYFASDQTTVLPSAIVTPASTTAYYVQGISAAGCASAKQKITVTVNALPAVPVISLSGATTICAGNSITIYATGTGTFQWYKDGSAIAGAVNSSYVITKSTTSDSGNYSVTVSNGACTSLSSNIITVTVTTCSVKFTVIKSVKDANNNGKAEVNEELTYTIMVKNIGSTAINTISVTDALPAKTVYVSGGTLNAGIVSFTANNLEVGTSTSFSFTVKVVSDLTGVSAISNLAIGSADGTDVPSVPEDPNNPGNPDPDCTGNCSTDITTNAVSGIAVIKKAVFVDQNNNGFAEEGETIKYSFEVKNTGDTTLNNVFLTDNLQGLVLTGNPLSLVPGEINSTNFNAFYEITKDDIQVGFVTNQALAEGTTPSGAKVNALSDNDNFIDDRPTVINIVAQNCAIEVFNAVSLNEDRINDEFHIKGLECYPNNSVEIYNRWGIKVFETSGYGANGNVFKGYSDGRTTISRGERLPDGTYFYVLKYLDEPSQVMHTKSGYLYITK